MSIFSRYLDAKKCLIPYKNGTPSVIQWTPYQTNLPSVDVCKAWDKNNYNEFALVCGKVSDVIAIDIDTEEGADYIYKLAGESPVRKRGSKGFTAFYKYNGEVSATWGVCELLSDKRCCHIPPSVHHKKGKPDYIWLDKELIGTELPNLNPDFVLFMNAKYPKKSKQYIPRTDYVGESVELHEAEEMLSYISSDCPRDEWVQVGMALRDEFGDAACHLWHQWSSKATRRYNHNDAQAAWRSFGNQGITIGTLVYMAKQGGWLPKILEDSGFTVDISYIFNKKKEHTDRPKELKVTGMVGKIADWITSSALVPQPALSLAAAITFVGMLKGHRIKNRVRGARTNMLCLAFASTGSGKDWPQDAIDRLAIACGLESNLLGKPTSGTALLRGIEKAQGVALLSIDEVGRYMGHITNKESQAHQGEIADYIIELYSSANKTFRGKQFADEKQNPHITIKNPHFCCIGSSVPEKLKAACNKTQVVDGFLNRWLVFATKDFPKKNFSAKAKISDSLVAEIKSWIEQNPIPMDSYGNLGDMKEVQFTPEAWDLYLKFEEEMHQFITKEPYPLNELYVRSAENAVKLATVICDDTCIGTIETQTAIDIVKQSNANLRDFASSITDSKHEENLNYLLEIITRYGRISLDLLAQKSRKLNARDRNSLLSQLVEMGEILAHKEGKKVEFERNL